MFNMVLWIYRRAWKCLVIEIWQGFEYVMDTENSECARVCSWIMLEQTFLEKKLFPNIRVVLAILLYNSLLKLNYLYYQFWTKESLSRHIWSQNPWICIIAKYRKIIKMPKFGTKNVLFEYFWQKCFIWIFLGKMFRRTIVIFKISTLKFLYLQNFTKKQI